MTADQVALWYLVASVCFILALKGLSHPSTARRGNLLGIAGMAIAVVVTLALVYSNTKNVGMILAGIVVGGATGAVVARRVQMTQMPELVAAFHSLVGLAAVLIAISAIHDPGAFGLHVPLPSGNKLELFIGTFIGAITFSGSVIAFGIVARPAAGGAVDPIPTGNRLELILGAAIGAITFSGSVIAWGKLSAKYKIRVFQGAPVTFKGQHWLNLALAIAMVVFIVGYTLTERRFDFYLVLAIAFLLGVLIIIPIGGADMPVVISMLNSYSGWAAAGIGFSLNNPMLIIAGSLVGSSGAILSYIMCKAMNRSFINVILGGFGAEPGAAAAGAEQKTVKSGSADDAAFIMGNAETVIIVPGYGLAVARAQHAVKELATKLRDKGVTVKYAIHPVAGRMPGHMNVLLAEAEVPYDQVFEMEDINGEFGSADVALILGANDVVNPLAEQKGSPIYGMPILEAYKAKTVIVNKRSMASGYAGLDNPLFYMDKTMMVFGDAKKVVEEMVKAIQ